MKYFKNLFFFIPVFFLFLLSGCQESATDSYKKTSEHSTSKLIGSKGGKVILSSNDIIASAEISPESIFTPEKIVISVKESIPAPLPENYTEIGDCINFAPEGIIFQKKAVLGIPFKSSSDFKKNRVKVKYYDPIADKWTNIIVKNIDMNNGIVYFETNHFSNYIAAIKKKEGAIIQENELQENEYFTGENQYNFTSSGTKKIVEKGCINRKNLPCGTPWHMTMFAHPKKKELVHIIDRDYTLNYLTGYPSELSEDGTYLTFNAKEIFPKVKESGDARLWDWECEFVLELTKLENYKVYSDSDPDFIQNELDEKIYAEITAIDENNVMISWKINIFQEIKPGSSMSIRFEARYKPDD